MFAYRWIPLSLVTFLALAVGCSILVQRDLSTVPPGQIGFDDMCGLQEYFDTLEIQASTPPRVVSALDLEGTSGGKVFRGGRERFAFENEFVLKHLRRVLKENWKRLPEAVATAKKVELEVHWAQRAGTKRVVTDRDAELILDSVSYDLPYQVCLSELLYGDALYRQRRTMWKLPLLGPPATTPAPDGGVTSDGGVSGAPSAADASAGH